MKPRCYARLHDPKNSECRRCELLDECEEEADLRELKGKRAEKLEVELQELDAALTASQAKYARLIRYSYLIAQERAREDPDFEVCSEDVWEVLRVRAKKREWLREELARGATGGNKWMGAVFRHKGSCWIKTGRFEPLGSHGRNIPIWILKEDYR